MDMENMNAEEAWDDELPFTESAPEPDIWDEGEWDDSEEEADFWDEEASEKPVETVEADVEENTDAETDEASNRQALIDAEVRRQVDAMVAAQYGGYINPYSGRPITSKAEWDAYQRAFAEDEQRQKLESMGITQEMLNEAVNNSPVVKQAQEVMARQQQNEANHLMQQEFAALQKEFPDCGLKNAVELMQTPEGRKAVELWSKAGISLADAYAVTHRAELKQKQSAAVKQGVLNQMNGKKHLTQTKGGGERAEIPAAVRSEYKKFFPNASDAEIMAMYQKNQVTSE